MREQTIFRRAKDRVNPFAMIDKEMLESPTLSWKAKGLLAYLLSRPDDWEIWLSALVKCTTDGESATTTGLQELERAGYLTRRKLRDARGRFVGHLILVHEIPVPDQERTVRQKRPQGDFPQMENPQMENPVINNTDIDTKTNYTNTPASGGDASSDNGHPLYQVVDVADLVDAAPDVPHTDLTASCENCGAIMERDADCPDCGTPTFWKLGKLTGRQRDRIKKLEKPDLLVAPGDDLGRRAVRLWSDGVYWRSASQRATFLKLKKVKPRGWFLQILSWAEEKRGITFSSFKKALNNPVQFQKWEDRQRSKPDAEGYAERRQVQDDAALAEAQAEASQVEPVDLEAMGIVTR